MLNLSNATSSDHDKRLHAVADVARRSLERGREQANHLERRAAASMSRNPWKTASIGAAAGLLVGLFAAFRARDGR